MKWKMKKIIFYIPMILIIVSIKILKKFTTAVSKSVAIYENAQYLFVS